MTRVPVVLSFGSNIGDRSLQIRRAVRALSSSVRVVRVSSLWETEPVDARDGSPHFLNAVVVGYTSLDPGDLLAAARAIERNQGRVRRWRNEPRPIDVDIIFYGAHLLGDDQLRIPHPRYRKRAFVTEPLHELALGWVDPVDGRPISRRSGIGHVERVGNLNATIP